jgi:hypothetical protein
MPHPKKIRKEKRKKEKKRKEKEGACLRSQWFSNTKL